MHFVLEVLFPFLVLLYLIDCIAYVRHQHLLFSSHFGRHFKLKKPGLHVMGLLPTSEVVISHNLAIFLTSRGLYTTASKHHTDSIRYEARSLRFIAYEDVAKLEVDGKVLRVNDEGLLKFPTSTNAQQIRYLLQELTCSEISGRHQKIREFLHKGTDLQKIRAIRENNQPLAYIKMLSSLLFVNVFGILPLSLYSGLSSYVNLSVIVYLSIGVYLLILISAYISRRKMFGISKSQTLLAMLPTILSPVTAMRITKEMTKEIYSHFDYIAIAAELLPSNEFRSMMREEYLRITHANQDSRNAELSEFLSLRKSVLIGLLNDVGFSLEELIAAPKRQDSSAASYCPICLSEYRLGTGKCIDCLIDLKQFNSN